MSRTEYFADPNLFLRYLTDDIPEQADLVERLLQRAKAGNVSLTTNAMVMAEIVWTLESHYGRTRAEIRDGVLRILNTRVSIWRRRTSLPGPRKPTWI